MSTFHETQAGSLEVTCFGWKPSKPSYLAIGTANGVVKFLWSDGTECDFPQLHYQSRTSSVKQVTCVLFHPYNDLLIAMWSDGVMRSWHNMRGTVSSQMSPHSVQYPSQLLVSFDPTGFRLLSADYRGVVSVWSCKQSGALKLLYTFKLKNGCSQLCLHKHSFPFLSDGLPSFAMDPHGVHGPSGALGDDSNAGGHSSDPSHNRLPSIFYVASSQDSIYMISDSGECSELLCIENSSFLLIEFIAYNSNLIFITSDMTLHQYKVSTSWDTSQTSQASQPFANGSEAKDSKDVQDLETMVSEEEEFEGGGSQGPERIEVREGWIGLTFLKSFKLSMKSGPRTQCMYLFDGLVAICGAQPLLRIFDVIHSDSYVLSLHDARHMAAPNDTIVRIHFTSRPYKALAGVTAKNRIVLWRFRYKTPDVKSLPPRASGVSGNAVSGVSRATGSYQILWNEEPSEHDWIILSPINVNASVGLITLGMSSLYNKRELCLAVFSRAAANKVKNASESTENDAPGEVKVFNESKSHFRQHGEFSFVQFAPNRLLVYTPDGKMRKIGTRFAILTMHCNQGVAFVSDGNQGELYHLHPNSANNTGSDNKADAAQNVVEAANTSDFASNIAKNMAKSANAQSGGGVVTQPVKLYSYTNLPNSQCLVYAYEKERSKSKFAESGQMDAGSAGSADNAAQNSNQLFGRRGSNASIINNDNQNASGATENGAEKESKWSALNAKVKTLNAAATSMAAMNASYVAARIGGNVVALNRSNIEIYALDGKFEYALLFEENEEGFPISMDLKQSVLAVVTTQNVLKVWDLDTRDWTGNAGDAAVNHKNGARVRKARLILPGKKLSDWIDAVQSIKVNASGTKVSLLSMDGDEGIFNHIFVYDIEKDEVNSFKLDANVNILDHFWEENDGRILTISYEKLKLPSSFGHSAQDEESSLSGSSSNWHSNPSATATTQSHPTAPISISTLPTATPTVTTDVTRSSDTSAQDTTHPNDDVLANDVTHSNTLDSDDESSDSRRKRMFSLRGVMSFFISPTGAVLPQETFLTRHEYIGVCVPDFVLINHEGRRGSGGAGIGGIVANHASQASQGRKNAQIQRKRIRDFVGINNTDAATNANLVDFSYYLTVGDLDQAYKSVQNIRSRSVWESMARMCVKTRRLDVADICLSNLSATTSDGSEASGGVANGAGGLVVTKIASSNIFKDYLRLEESYDNIKDTASNNEVVSGKDALPGAEDKKHDKKLDRKDLLRLALIGVDLGMYGEAEKLLRECKRFDLIVRLQQALGRWQQSVEVCEQFDRIYLKAARYQHGRFLQESQRPEAAMKAYEQAGNPVVVAKLLLGQMNQTRPQAHQNAQQQQQQHQVFQQRSDALLKYVEQVRDEGLYKWYAQYLESLDDVDAALHFYEEAGDLVSLVRLCCDVQDPGMAQQVVDTYTNSPSFLGAALQLGSYFEDANDPKQAIHYYQKAQAFDHALRLCMENGLDEILVDMALKVPQDCILFKRSNPREMAAKYFEEQGDLQRAVVLYQKADNINRAVDLCVQGRLFNELKNIAMGLLQAGEAGDDALESSQPSASRSDEKEAENNKYDAGARGGTGAGKKGKERVDPGVALRFADFFISNEQHENAVSMLVIAKEFERALELCMNYDVGITSDLAEKLTPPKREEMEDAERQHRVRVLLMLAKCLRQQQSYQLACKKYTQAGDRLKAIKCLIKAGDTSKVIYYASKTKNNEVSILTANYLQSLDWHSNPQYTKSIIQFYNAAKAYLQLSYFYDACAMIEIDDYRDYDKALRALKQAHKQLKRCKNGNQNNMVSVSAEEIGEKLNLFAARVKLVQKFVDARKLAQTEPEKMVQMCEELIKAPDAEASVRTGDVYALMIEYYYSKNDFSEAYNLMERMRNDAIVLGPYLDKEMMKQICNEMGVSDKHLSEAEDQVSEDIVDEDIVDDME